MKRIGIFTEQSKVIGKNMETGEALREVSQRQAGNEKLFKAFGDFERVEKMTL